MLRIDLQTTLWVAELTQPTYWGGALWAWRDKAGDKRRCPFWKRLPLHPLDCFRVKPPTPIILVHAPRLQFLELLMRFVQVLQLWKQLYQRAPGTEHSRPPRHLGTVQDSGEIYSCWCLGPANGSTPESAGVSLCLQQQATHRTSLRWLPSRELSACISSKYVSKLRDLNAKSQGWELEPALYLI